MNKIFVSLCSAALWAFLAVSASAGSSAPRTLASMCDQFRYESQTTACLKASGGMPADEKAVGICNQWDNLDQVVKCVQAIAGREYTTEEIKICGRIRYLDPTIDCMRAAGRSIRGGHAMRCEDRIRERLRECRRNNSGSDAVLSCLENSLN